MIGRTAVVVTMRDGQVPLQGACHRMSTKVIARVEGIMVLVITLFPGGPRAQAQRCTGFVGSGVRY